LNSKNDIVELEFRSVDKESEICIKSIPGGVGNYEMVPDDFENLKEFE